MLRWFRNHERINRLPRGGLAIGLNDLRRGDIVHFTEALIVDRLLLGVGRRAHLLRGDIVLMHVQSVVQLIQIGFVLLHLGCGPITVQRLTDGRVNRRELRAYRPIQLVIVVLTLAPFDSEQLLLALDSRAGLI